MAVIVSMDIKRKANSQEPALLTTGDLHQVGEAMRTGMLKDMDDGRDVATGAAFAPLDDEYADETGTSKSRLRRTGQLRGSFQIRVRPSRVDVGPTVPYARFLHYGTDDTPDRRFVGLSRRTLTKVRKLVASLFKKRFVERSRADLGAIDPQGGGASE